MAVEFSFNLRITDQDTGKVSELTPVNPTHYPHGGDSPFGFQGVLNNHHVPVSFDILKLDKDDSYRVQRWMWTRHGRRVMGETGDEPPKELFLEGVGEEGKTVFTDYEKGWFSGGILGFGKKLEIVAEKRSV